MPQSVIIYDKCPQFTAIFSDGQTLTNQQVTFKQLLDYIDKLGIDKQNVTIYNRFMELSYF